MFSLFKKFGRQKRKPARIYLDHAAAAPLLPEAREAMLDLWKDHPGNASAIHAEGQYLKKILSDCRQSVARICEVQPDQVIFTSGGTEANNLAIRGVIENLYRTGRAYETMEVITSSIEHPATYNTLKHLSGLGIHITEIPVAENGRIDLAELKSALSARTVLVSVSYVNSEIGTIESVLDISRIIAKGAPEALLFVDAAQAPLWLPCVLPQLRADILSFDSGKFGGPQGVGMLVTSKRARLAPVLFGGGQENGLRPGTEPVALILGATIAFKAAQADYKKRGDAVAKVRNYAWDRLQSVLPEAILNGAAFEDRVANNLNLSLPGIDSEYAVVALDTHGVAASTKSACSSASGGQSKVVMAITGDPLRASSTLRFTFGPEITYFDADRTAAILKEHVTKTVKW